MGRQRRPVIEINQVGVTDWIGIMGENGDTMQGHKAIVIGVTVILLAGAAGTLAWTTLGRSQLDSTSSGMGQGQPADPVTAQPDSSMTVETAVGNDTPSDSPTANALGTTVPNVPAEEMAKEDVPIPSNLPSQEMGDEVTMAIADYIAATYPGSVIREIALMGSGAAPSQQVSGEDVFWNAYLVRLEGGKDIGVIASAQESGKPIVSETTQLTIYPGMVYDTQTQEYGFTGPVDGEERPVDGMESYVSQMREQGLEPRL